MTKRILISTMILVPLVGLTLLGASPLSGSWMSEITIRPDDDLFIRSLDSLLVIDYTVDGHSATSFSQLQLLGYIWQEFSVTGALGAFGYQANVLFGPSTADFIYAQMIGSISIAGLDFDLFFAQLSSAVLGGAADGFAIRVEASVGAMNVISITEMGARIADDDFDGITIVHAISGLERSYITDPVVFGQGFTGQKITTSGLSFGCVDDVSATLYITCAGFDFIAFEIAGIDLGIPWMTLGVDITFQTSSKTLTLTPTIVLADVLCVNVYAELITEPSMSSALTGIRIYGLGFGYSQNGVTVKELTVFDTARYAITTPEYGSVIESIADALDDGHAYYSDYWEMFSIEVERDGCCGGTNRFLANVYFDHDAGGIFGWGMTYLEGDVAINATINLSGQLEVSADGLEYFGFGIEVSW